MSVSLPRVTLTFDNGPDTEVTPHVLDVLAERGVLTTFFMVGHRLRAPGAREVTERAHAEGHWIGNHTLSHARPFGQMAGGDALREIEQTQSLIGELSHPEKLFRPMGGGGHLDQRLFSRDALAVLGAGGYTVVLWNALPRDWVDPDGWLERALAQCLDSAVMVLHDIASGAMDHLNRFLDQAQRAGVQFTQAFPDSCVPIRRGETVGSLSGLVTPEAGA